MITKHKISGIALGAALAFGAAATAAQASTIFATSVDSYSVGPSTFPGGLVDPARQVQANALGAADGNFLSLGLGGEVILSFGRLFTGPMQAIEVTFGNRDNHVESVNVFAGLGGVWTSLGSITNTTGSDILNFVGIFDQLKLVDTSPVANRRDGFDIDAVSVTPAAIPLPAGGVLLLTALGAVAALRRRKEAV